MSSACEKSPRFCQPSTVMIALCVTVCDDCRTFTPGAYTEIGALVTLPVEFTTQCAAVTTMRLVHRATLQTLDPFTKRTTAVLPTAELPPTTARAGDVAIGTALKTRVSTSTTRSAALFLNRTRRRNAPGLLGTLNTL
jgi:hypothetical protein